MSADPSLFHAPVVRRMAARAVSHDEWETALAVYHVISNAGSVLAEVHELQIRFFEVAQQSHGGLQVIAGLGRDAQLVTLNG